MRMNIIVAVQFCGNEASRDVPEEHSYNPLIRVGRFRILGGGGGGSKGEQSVPNNYISHLKI